MWCVLLLWLLLLIICLHFIFVVIVSGYLLLLLPKLFWFNYRFYNYTRRVKRNGCQSVLFVCFTTFGSAVVSQHSLTVFIVNWHHAFGLAVSCYACFIHSIGQLICHHPNQPRGNHIHKQRVIRFAKCWWLFF